MKRSCFLAVAATLAISPAVWADDSPEISTPFLPGNALALKAMSSSSPFSNGLSQLLSAWTREGIFASELADQIPWLQSMDADEINQRTRWMDYRMDIRINNYAVPVPRGVVADNHQQDRNRQDRVRHRHHEDDVEHRARHDHHDWHSIDRGLSDQRHDHHGTKNNSSTVGDHHASHASHAPNSGGPTSHSSNFKSNTSSHGSTPAHVPAPTYVPPAHMPAPAHAPPPPPSRGSRR